jgi:hypothetical protein
MLVYARHRQEGKTTDLIGLAAEESLHIVCVNRNEVMRVAAEARKMGLDIPFPLTWQEFASGLYHGRGIKGFVIDNLDLCIQQATPIPIRAVSLTDED